MTKFKIQIVKVETVKKEDQEYKIIADTGNKEDNGKMYAYVPVMREREVESDVLKMEVETLNLELIVAAIFSSDKK